MANDAATLNGKLATALRDTAYGVWTTGEMTDLVTWAVADLWPGICRELTDVDQHVTIVSGTRSYALGASVGAVYRVDIIDSAGTYIGPMADGTWEISGGGSAVLTLSVNQSVNDNYAGGTFNIRGYAPYTFTSGAQIPDELVRLVLAKARGEAYRRMAGDRVQFKNWQARNQAQDMSVNELILLVNEADGEAERLFRRHRTIRKPVPGRI
jgi:hypothetical protein